ELLGSTGIGEGIAIPHTKHTGVDKLLGSVGVSQTGVNFGSRDGAPVFVFVLIISPVDQPVVHLRALETVSRVLRDEKLVKSLREASTTGQLFDHLEQYVK
ncbi:MAG: PTS sugar transporter subunit IIA, partial [Gemmataceae bacterium]